MRLWQRFIRHRRVGIMVVLVLVPVAMVRSSPVPVILLPTHRPTRPFLFLIGQYPPNTPHGQAGSTVPLVYPNQYQASGSPSNTTTVSAGAPVTPYQPPPSDANGFYPSTAVGYNATLYVPPPPEPNYHGGGGAVPSGYSAGGPTPWGVNGAGNTTSVYGGAGNTASAYGGSQTALGAAGMGGGLPQGPPPGAHSGYRGHAEVY